MEITLTTSQWTQLKTVVAQGVRAERKLAKPIEITNSAISIEIESDTVTITLED